MSTEIDAGMTPARQPDVAVRLPATPGSVSVARHAALGLLDTVSVSDGRRGDIVLATSEAVTNAIQHGSPEPESRTVGVQIWCMDTVITVSVSDEGGGITPRVSDEAIGLGLGIPIVISLADEVRFSKRDGNFDVTMRFVFAEPSL